MTDATLEHARPRIDHPEELDRMVRQIVEQVDPVAIYLFGSRARGDADAESDYDLMIVVSDDLAVDRALRDQIWDAARAEGIGATPFLSRAEAYAWRRHEVGTIEYEVEVDGLQLWPRGRRVFPADLAQRSWTMNVNVVEEWLRRAEKDLTAARKCCEGTDAVPDQGAYHVQQAAEKLVKAALVAHNLRPRKGHEIGEFAKRLPASFADRKRFLALGRFSKFVWVFRYPDESGAPPEPEPSVAEVEAWIEELATLKADVEGWLEQQAGGARGER